MCIVIDINTLSSVFSPTSEKHCEFKLVKSWIDKGNGFIVFGGSKYMKELSYTYSYLRLIQQLKVGGMAIKIKDIEVDYIETEIKSKVATGCDDHHIIALLAASRCCLLCSEDSRSFSFIKDRSLYPKGMPPVKIYSSARNRRLLKKTDKTKISNIE